MKQKGLTNTEIVLRNNVQSLSALVDNKILFLDDNDCLSRINALRSFGIEHEVVRDLLFYFQNQKRGMIKADICRGAALFPYGGWYLDVDVYSDRDFREILYRLKKYHTFLTVIPTYQSDKSFFQAIIWSSPKNLIIREYLILFSKLKSIETASKENIGTLLMYQAVQKYKNSVYLLRETRGVNYLKKHSRSHLKLTNLGYWCDNVIYDPSMPLEKWWFKSRVKGSRLC